MRFHGQEIKHNASDQGNCHADRRICLDQERRIVAGGSGFRINIRPFGECPFFRSGKPDFLNAAEQRKAQAALFRALFHDLPAQLHLRERGEHTDHHIH